MANNRMWLINERLGAKACLAKYYPSTGWYAVTDGGNVGALFDLDDEQSEWGSTDWQLVTEMEADPALMNRLRVVTRADKAA